MKRIVLCFCIFCLPGLFSHGAFAQAIKDCISAANSVVFPLEKPNKVFHTSRVERFACREAGGAFDVVSIDTNGISMLTYNVVAKQFSSYELTKLYKANNQSIHDVCANDEVLIVASSWNGGRLQIYERENADSHFVFSRAVELPEEFRYINQVFLLPDRKVLVCSWYLCSRCDINDFVKVGVFDLKTDKIEIVKSFELDFQGLTYFTPHRLFDVSGDRIFFAHLGSYKIYEYDSNLDLLDSIVADNSFKGWKTYPKKKMKKVLRKYKDPISRIWYLNDYTDYSRLNNIYVGGENELIVGYFLGGNDMLTDVWKKENGKWKLYRHALSDISLNNSDRYNRLYTLGWTNLLNVFDAKQKKVFRINYDLPLDLKRLELMSEDDFEGFKQNYLSEHEQVIVLDEWDYDFDLK